MNILLLPLLLPLIFGFIGFFLPKLRNESCFLGILFSLYYGIRIFLHSQDGGLYYSLLKIGGMAFDFKADALSGLFLILVSSFGLLILIYSFRSVRFYPLLKSYYLGFSLSIVCANGILLTNNFPLFLSFWFLFTLFGFLSGLFKSIGRSLKVSIGSTLPLLIGILLLSLYGIEGLSIRNRLGFEDPLLIASFSLLLWGGLYRMAEGLFVDKREPLPSAMALICSVLNRIVGFYLLLRLFYYLFELPDSQILKISLLLIGALFLLLPLIKLLFEKDLLSSLLLFTISEIGWSILSIGTLTLFGITASLFYTINSLVYTTGLFLCLGCIRERIRTTSIDRLRGLVKAMPITGISLIVLSLSISGIPLLNGFFSKIIVCEAILHLNHIFLIVPIIGWVIVFIYLIKNIPLLFKRPEPGIKETGLVMWVPAALLGLTSILSGVFVYKVIETLIYPSLPFIIPLMRFPLLPP